jgi:protein TonB
MAKVVKYCTPCDEGFAEKFGFCPNCGGSLTAYEMNPGATEKTNAAPIASNFEAQPVAGIAAANGNSARIEKTSEPVTAKKESFLAVDHDEILDLGVEKEIPLTAAPVPAVNVSSTAPAEPVPSFKTEHKPNGNGSYNGNKKAAAVAPAIAATSASKYTDGAYHITFVEEKNAKGRNLLLLGSFFLVTVISLGGVIRSLYNANLNIGSLSDESSLMAYMVNDVPPEPEPEPPKPKTNDDAGGGGGGGREEPTPTSKGRLAPQMPEPPLITPTKTIIQRDKPELVMQATTQGPRQNIPTTVDRYGDPTSKFDIASDGQGSGGGQGSGRGTGQGSGRGTGAGSGTGSGMGSGIGDGIGGGRGSGIDGDAGDPPKPKPPAPKPPVGPTVTVQILSKPRPSYTDAARQNQVTGVVRLRVTFLASGQIGGVSPVSGLPYGLTEQAIASAKQIRFEPAKVNGVPQTVTKQIEYSFSIY